MQNGHQGLYPPWTLNKRICRMPTSKTIYRWHVLLTMTATYDEPLIASEWIVMARKSSVKRWVVRESPASEDRSRWTQKVRNSHCWEL
jgi:hypothetical protein